MLDINTIVYKLPIEVDTTKLIGELEALVLPFFKKKADNPNWRTGRPSSNISITGLPNTPLNDWFNANNGAMTVLKDGDTGELLARDYDKHTLGFAGAWRREVNAYYAGSCIQYSSGYAILLIDSLTTCSQYTMQMYKDSACSIPVGPVTTHFMSELGLSNSAGCSKNTNFYGYGFGKMSCSSSNPVGLVPYPKIAKK